LLPVLVALSLLRRASCPLGAHAAAQPGLGLANLRCDAFPPPPAECCVMCPAACEMHSRGYSGTRAGFQQPPGPFVWRLSCYPGTRTALDSADEPCSLAAV